MTLDAIRARHVYATSDKNLRVIARYNGALAGEVIARPASVAVTLEITDDDEPQADYKIQVYGDKVGGAPAALDLLDAK